MLNGFEENEEVETDGFVIDGLGSTSMGDGSMSPLASLYCSSNTSSMTTKRLPRYFLLCLLAASVSASDFSIRNASPVGLPVGVFVMINSSMETPSRKLRTSSSVDVHSIPLRRMKRFLPWESLQVFLAILK